ncbi:MAG: tetratricopeptide repeat protein [Thermoguttaceae bacterium]|jgi:tetratricopeptide (TPR) repeat protein
MSRPSAFGIFILSLALASATVELWARDKETGQADFDQAIQLKSTANTVDELSAVIHLCESALAKGLEKADRQFAEGMLSASLAQRGTAIAAKLLETPLPPDWPEQRKTALADLERALKQNPRQGQTLYWVARLNLALPDGDAKRGRAALDEAIEQAADEPPLLAQALLLRGETQTDVNRRLADLDRAVRVLPVDAGVWRARGAALADLGKDQAALDDFNKAIALDPQNAAAYVIKAMLLARDKKFTEAQSVLDRGAKLLPKSVDLPVQKARIYILQTDVKSALKELNQAATIDPKNLMVFLLRAAVQQELGDKAKALEDVEKVLELRPGLPQAMRDRASLLVDFGKVDAAIAELEKLRKAQPKDALTLLQLGLLYNSQKKYQQAVGAFTAVLAGNKRKWMAYRGRGDALLSLGRWAEAVADYDQGMVLRPRDIGILNNLAWVLGTAPAEQVRDGKRAVVLATQACRLTDYKQAYILSTLAAGCAETGDFESAIKWSAEAVRLGSKDQVETLKKELESYRAKKPWRENLPQPEEK